MAGFRMVYLAVGLYVLILKLATESAHTINNDDNDLHEIEEEIRDILKGYLGNADGHGEPESARDKGRLAIKGIYRDFKDDFAEELIKKDDGQREVAHNNEDPIDKLDKKSDIQDEDIEQDEDIRKLMSTLLKNNKRTQKFKKRLQKKIWDDCSWCNVARGGG